MVNTKKIAMLLLTLAIAVPAPILAEGSAQAQENSQKASQLTTKEVHAAMDGIVYLKNEAMQGVTLAQKGQRKADHLMAAYRSAKVGGMLEVMPDEARNRLSNYIVQFDSAFGLKDAKVRGQAVCRTYTNLVRFLDSMAQHIGVGQVPIVRSTPKQEAVHGNQATKKVAESVVKPAVSQSSGNPVKQPTGAPRVPNKAPVVQTAQNDLPEEFAGMNHEQFQEMLAREMGMSNPILGMLGKGVSWLTDNPISIVFALVAVYGIYARLTGKFPFGKDEKTAE